MTGAIAHSKAKRIHWGNALMRSFLISLLLFLSFFFPFFLFFFFLPFCSVLLHDFIQKKRRLHKTDGQKLYTRFKMDDFYKNGSNSCK